MHEADTIQTVQCIRLPVCPSSVANVL